MSLLAGLLGKDTDHITPGQVSYDLRRLRAHGLIDRVPGSHRYQTSDRGLHHAMLITHLDTRLLQPGLAQLTDPARRHPTHCAAQHGTTSAPSTTSLGRPDSPHETELDSIFPASPVLAS